MSDFLLMLHSNFWNFLAICVSYAVVKECFGRHSNHRNDFKKITSMISCQKNILELRQEKGMLKKETIDMFLSKARFCSNVKEVETLSRELMALDREIRSKEGQFDKSY